MGKEIYYNNFGSKMVIIEYVNWDKVKVVFPEYNWESEYISMGNIRKGKVKCPYEPRLCEVGYLGEGEYLTYDCINNQETKAYQHWKHMINRCYNKKQLKARPSYMQCEVCDEWLNFQNFAEWYEENYYEVEGEKMCLDKDILVKGNKIYYPETCIFVPEKINTLFVKSNKARGKYPIGVAKQNKKYKATINKYGENVHLGYYNTPNEAFEVYKTEKEQYVKEIAEKYKNIIPQKLYEIMNDYNVEIED